MKSEDAIKRLEVIEAEVNELKKIINQPDDNKSVEMSEFLFEIINNSNLKITENGLGLYIGEYYLLLQDLKNQRVWVSYDKIWSVFYDRFKLNYEQTQEFIKSWVETNLNWKGFTPPV
jgi:hypothetical protein